MDNEILKAVGKGSILSLYQDYLKKLIIVLLAFLALAIIASL